MWTVDKDVNMKVIFAIMNTTWAVVNMRPEKNSGLYKIWTQLTSVILVQCSTNWANISQLEADHYVGWYNLAKWWINDCKYMKTI